MREDTEFGCEYRPSFKRSWTLRESLWVTPRKAHQAELQKEAALIMEARLRVIERNTLTIGGAYCVITPFTPPDFRWGFFY